MKWIQIFCTTENGYSSPSAAKRIDEHLTSQTAAFFVAPEGVPIKNENGEYEVRVLDARQAVFVQNILTKHYGLTICSVVEHEK